VLVKHVVFYFVVEAVVGWFEFVPGPGTGVFQGEIQAAHEVRYVAAEAYFEPVDAVVGV
jgi:hypothetical protein